ncbi:MAG: hypothetical protein PVG74_06365 [Desulfobacterales bacterium]
MRVVEPRNDTPAIEIDSFSIRRGPGQHILIDSGSDDATRCHAQGADLWLAGIEGGYFSIIKDQV